jgi:hypothetical protein
MLDRNVMYNGLVGSIEGYVKDTGHKPQVIALGKTHLEDLHDYLEYSDGKLLFEDIEVIEHNDPFGVLFAHDNRK